MPDAPAAARAIRQIPHPVRQRLFKHLHSLISVRQYLFSVGNSCGLTRTLGRIDVCRDAGGRMCYSAGNSAVVFKIRRNGAYFALRCYTHKGRNLEAVYGPKLLPGELFVYRDDHHGDWVDVVLDRWVEGETLQERIVSAGPEEFARLAEAFDRLAAAMTADDCAHGDLKPENIIVQPDGMLRTIDLDASFLPAFAGKESPELGTAAFQHPARTAADFDARLDDFPAALISTALHALACDPSLRERYGIQDTLLVDPHRLPEDAAFREILALFKRLGMAAEYRIARLMLSPSHRLYGLPKLLAYAVRAHAETAIPPAAAEASCVGADAVPELFVEHGLWGYRCPQTGRTVIPPLYDCGFDFTEGLAAVRLDHAWHYIDTDGHPVIRCPECEAVKPFCNGKARILRDGRIFEIDRTGRETVSGACATGYGA